MNNWKRIKIFGVIGKRGLIKFHLFDLIENLIFFFDLHFFPTPFPKFPKLKRQTHFVSIQFLFSFFFSIKEITMEEMMFNIGQSTIIDSRVCFSTTTYLRPTQLHEFPLFHRSPIPGRSCVSWIPSINQVQGQLKGFPLLSHTHTHTRKT